MKKELQLELKEKYPELLQGMDMTIQESCMAWGMEIGEGWSKIMSELCEKISKKGVVLTQVKEKFGTLRVYFSAPEKVHDEVDNLINKAEGKSAKTCEVCGGDGKTRGGGWLVTLCDSCDEERHKERE